MKPPVWLYIVFACTITHCRGVEEAILNDVQGVSNITSDVVFLNDFYQALGGDEWYNATGWNSGDPCPTGSWYGVDCDNGTVTAIDLTGNNLVGTLPASLVGITSLTKVNVGENSGVVGTLPDYSSLILLKEYHLNGTKVEGPLPDWIVSLPDLRSMSFSDTNLYGTPFPLSWCTLPKIESISLGNQNITGTLPDCVNNLINLSNFALFGTALEGALPNWGNLTQLKNLELSFNNLEGPISDSIQGMTSLQYLILNDNNLSGTIPAFLAQLVHLHELHLRRNSFYGTLPKLGSYSHGLTRLINLGVDTNNLTGTIPDWLGEMSSLSVIGLSCNNFYGPLPTWLTTDPARRGHPIEVNFGCNFNITSSSLPTWCLQENRCGPTDCVSQCAREPPTPAPVDAPIDKTVMIAMLCFIGVLFVGNIILLTVYIARKIRRAKATRDTATVPLMSSVQ